MNESLANLAIFLITMFAGLCVLFLLMRFLMQMSRVDYYNPLCQAVVKLTDPLVRPLKAALPTIRSLDFATLTAALLVQTIAITLIVYIEADLPFHTIYIAWSLTALLDGVLRIYFFALIIMVLASGVAPGSSHPALALTHQITEPVCAPARKLLPPVGGLDLSVILVFVAITILDRFLVAQLALALGIPRGIILGL